MEVAVNIWLQRGLDSWLNRTWRLHGFWWSARYGSNLPPLKHPVAWGTGNHVFRVAYLFPTFWTTSPGTSMDWASIRKFEENDWDSRTYLMAISLAMLVYWLFCTCTSKQQAMQNEWPATIWCVHHSLTPNGEYWQWWHCFGWLWAVCSQQNALNQCSYARVTYSQSQPGCPQRSV